MRHLALVILFACVATNAFVAVADSGAESGETVQIRYQSHHFEPLLLTVTAGRPLTVQVINNSQETIEFESFKLNREKSVSPGETISVKLPALSQGSYDFYDDFHQDVPQGTIVAK